MFFACSRRAHIKRNALIRLLRIDMVAGADEIGSSGSSDLPLAFVGKHGLRR